MYNTFHFRVSDVQPLTTKVLDDDDDRYWKDKLYTNKTV